MNEKSTTSEAAELHRVRVVPKIPGRFKGCIGCWLGNHTHNGVGPHCPAPISVASKSSRPGEGKQ